VQVAGGEFPAERPCGLVVPVHEAQQGGGELFEAAEVVGGDDLLLDDGEEGFWFSQDACSGVWIMIAFGWARASSMRRILAAGAESAP
jgi:hypothetical protein